MEEQKQDLSADSTQPVQAANEAPAPIGQAEAPKKSRRLTMTVALLVLTIVASSSGLAFMLARNSEKAAQESAQAEQRYDVPLLKVASQGPFTGYYPKLDSNVGDSDILYHVYETLVTYEDQTRIVPQLATSWTNPDEKTWVFQLKKGVTFHTGRTMTAKDVKYSIEVMKGTLRGDWYAPNIEEVNVIDDFKVEIKTSKPDPLVLNGLASMAIIDSQATDVTSPVNGSGPYTLKSGTIPSEDKIELVAFEGYHGERPHVRELHFISEPEGMTPEHLESGEFDVNAWALKELVEGVDQQRWSVVRSNTLGVSTIGLNHELAGSPLQDVRVRRALYRAIDPEAIIEARNTFGKPIGQLVTPEVPGHDPSIVNPGRDLEEARRLLAEAGYADGLTLEFTYFHLAEPTVFEIERQLAEAGVTLKHDKHTEVSTIYKKVVEAGTAELWWRTTGSDLFDGLDEFRNYQAPYYQDDELDAMIAKVESMMDPAERVAALQEISRFLMDDVAAIPVFSEENIAVYPSYLKGVEREFPGIMTGIPWHRAYATQPVASDG